MPQIDSPVVMNFHLFDISAADMSKFVKDQKVDIRSVFTNVRGCVFVDGNIAFWIAHNRGSDFARVGLCPESCDDKFLNLICEGKVNLYKIRNRLWRHFTPLYSKDCDFDSLFEKDKALLKSY